MENINMTDASLVLVLLAVGVALSLLIVFFVSPKAFPRKEFIGAIWPLAKKYFWPFAGLLVIQQVLISLPSAITDVVQALTKLGDDEPVSGLLNFLVSIFGSKPLAFRRSFQGLGIW